MKTNELTEAIASIAPNYTEAEHAKAAERLAKDMDSERLIYDAAPYLLAACRAILRDLRECRDTGSCHRSRDSQIVDIASAIAKAEGR